MKSGSEAACNSTSPCLSLNDIVNRSCGNTLFATSDTPGTRCGYRGRWRSPAAAGPTFEVRGAIAFERRAVRCLGEPLPRESDRDVISDALRDAELLFGVGVRANRQQGENPDDVTSMRTGTRRPDRKPRLLNPSLKKHGTSGSHTTTCPPAQTSSGSPSRVLANK